ncbi:extracellular solute-binding protein, family 1 [Desulforamulus reducens MI-1]|uniref:Extracellular solute-binding protein, family 1 n=1 Tax=Desulforamulus reducens (strain ATCC BAA-1160 / DSM 100696 / MI-1) TaxID=349161 RepID=A4J6V8_DESRM|nr:substrate-binding domain-containing protein [Desulforamulus reducens]ABO50811.1 extracellular solute-binding protein, family 1 [Desulforamulus reducens MI-1]
MKNRSLKYLALLLTMLMLVVVGCAQQQTPKEEVKKEAAEPAIKDVILATTTSTQDSGLLDVLKPEFEKKTGYNLKIIAVGTGAALKMGEKGEADVLLTHAAKSEKPLVDNGIAINYNQVMHNDFIIVGPENDPAGIKNAKATAEAMKMIADKGAVFVSRGDDSGTHKKELGLWKEAQIEPKGQKWYQESGTGMGATLNISSEKQGYTLTDRATYLAQKDKVKLAILLEGDKSLLNIYHVMNVNPKKFDKVNAEGGKAFVDFMLAKDTQEIIAKFGVEKYGQPLFFADANK